MNDLTQIQHEEQHVGAILKLYILINIHHNNLMLGEKFSYASGGREF